MPTHCSSFSVFFQCPLTKESNTNSNPCLSSPSIDCFLFQTLIFPLSIEFICLIQGIKTFSRTLPGFYFILLERHRQSVHRTKDAFVTFVFLLTPPYSIIAGCRTPAQQCHHSHQIKKTAILSTDRFATDDLVLMYRCKMNI